MATATSSRLLAAAALVAMLALASCGGAARQDGGHAGGAPARFAWLRPARRPPTGNRRAAVRHGCFLAIHPAGARYGPTRARFPRRCWERTTASAATSTRRPGPARRRWPTGAASARPTTGEEGDRNVLSEASASGLRFRSGTGSCVIDRYGTTTDARYREIACIVRGARGTTVVVAAARPADWPQLAPQLERAVASFST